MNNVTPLLRPRAAGSVTRLTRADGTVLRLVTTGPFTVRLEDADGNPVHFMDMPFRLRGAS